MVEYISEEKQTTLTRQQKQAVGVLSIGTFLEYFDLMLYVHMVVLLNELFFPKTDPHIASLLSAAAFCSTYALRPIGAYIFGKIGDNIGRKQTVIITTLMMSLSCVVMANLPTYEQIGISAAWIVTICRMIQGISSLGEITGAQLYLTEMTKPPIQYPVVASSLLSAVVGSVFALGIAALFSSFGFNWRIAFWIGAVIALVGAYARVTLRETPEFANAKLRMQRILEKAKKDPKILDSNPILQEKVNKKTAIALFLIDSAMPIFFYLTYIHFGNYLKITFNYSSEQVISHNFIVGIIYLFFAIVQTYLCYKVHPLKIIRVRVVIFTVFLCLYPYLLSRACDQLSQITVAAI
ncbi:MAG: MFS transporter [Rickettsia endosymbiont of Bryobia graminum]|nr:MFS transporter [Rickettsia endosymbiont of Bryobia graminum]